MTNIRYGQVLPEQGEAGVGGDEVKDDDDDGHPEKNEQADKVTCICGHRCLSDCTGCHSFFQCII